MHNRGKTSGKGKARKKDPRRPQPSSGIAADPRYITTGLRSPETEEEIMSQLKSISECQLNPTTTSDVYCHWTTQYYAEDFVMSPVHSRIWSGKPACLEGLQRLFDNHPGFRQELTDSSCHLHLKAGYADVYLSFDLIDFTPGVILQDMAVLEWRLREGRWFIVRRTGMRANPLMSSQPGSPENTPAGSPEQR